MKNNKNIKQMTFVGCLIGAAFQRLTTQLETALKEADLNLSASEYMILRALYHTDGLQPCDICNMVGKDKGAISRTLRTLASKELVSIQQISHKCQRIYLTPNARDIEANLMNVATERHQALINLTSESEVKTLRKVLETIINSK